MKTDTLDTRVSHMRPNPPPLPQAARPTAPALPGAAPGPLSAEDLATVREAADLRKKILKTARTARGSGTTSLVIGLLALLCSAISPSASAVLVSLSITAIGIIEITLGNRLRRGDPSAGRNLAFNQLALLGVIALYCLSQMLGYDAQAVKNSILSPEVRQVGTNIAAGMDEIVDRWGALAVYGFYGLVIFLSVLFQGGMAWYYARRGRYARRFHQSTPAWVLDLLGRTDI